MGYKNKNFGNQLEILRKERGLTNEKVAEIVGVSPQTIGRYIKEGLVPDDVFLDKLAGLFKTSKDQLLFPETFSFEKPSIKEIAAISTDGLPAKERECVEELVAILRGYSHDNKKLAQDFINHIYRNFCAEEEEPVLRKISHQD